MSGFCVHTYLAPDILYTVASAPTKTDSVLMRTVYTVYKVKSYPVQKKTNFIVEKVL